MMKEEPIEKKFDLNTLERKMAFIESILFVSKDPVEPETIMNYLNIFHIRLCHPL